ncbi:phosphoglycolate phosphatase [Sulfurovum sp.]|uniref:phosphoglycolate phosphatase n=1 Tax=Sulfurovum sp. TaxID=1969726 RepID=UPI002867C3E4|nr:phosphoglycolate phosphatase [Sulfurovum sp.]
MKFSDKKLLLFDLDGTLIDSAPDLAYAVNLMLEKLERNTFSEEVIHGWVGNGAQILVKRALSGNVLIDDNLDESYVAEALEIFFDFYAKHLCDATYTYANVPHTLRTLKNRGYRLVIVTNKPFAFVAPILNSLDLEGLFELVLGGDSLAVKKPDPAPLLHACSVLKTEVHHCVMIGDSRNDIQAANACSMHSVGVSYGYNYGQKIDVFNPTVVIDDFAELLKVL